MTLWAAAEHLGVGQDVTMALVAGAVGPGAARELLVRHHEADLPDPEELLADPGSFRLPDRGDKQYAVLAAVAAAVAADCTKGRWHAAFSLVEQAVAEGCRTWPPWRPGRWRSTCPPRPRAAAVAHVPGTGDGQGRAAGSASSAVALWTGRRSTRRERSICD